MCDVCGEQRSMVYCRSDAACLCFSCDCKVHSSNALSKRHSRTPVCERCNSQPAAVRCIEERVSLCQNCDWMGHGPSTQSQNHKRQTINSYSGCPSSEELSSVLSFGLDFSSMTDTACEQKLRLMNIAEDSAKTSLVPSEDKNNLAASASVGTCEANVRTGSSSLPEQKSTLQSLGQQIRSSATASLSKVSDNVFH